MDILFGWLRDAFESSAASNVAKAMVAFESSPWADFSAPWYKLLWSAAFGLSLMILLLLVAIPRIVFFGIQGTTESAGKAIQTAYDVPKTIALGVAGLLFVKSAQLVADLVEQACIAGITAIENIPGTGVTAQLHWYSPLLESIKTDDLMNSLNIATVSWLGAWGLRIETQVIGQSAYIAAAMVMIVFVMRRNRLGGWLYQVGIAGLLMTLITKIVQTLWLGAWCIYLLVGSPNRDDIPLQLSIAFIGAAFVPFICFIALVVQRMIAEGKVRAKAKLERENWKRQDAARLQGMEQRRVGIMHRSAARTKKYVREAGEAAGVGLVSVGLKKTTQAVVARKTVKQAAAKAAGVTSPMVGGALVAAEFALNKLADKHAAKTSHVNDYSVVGHARKGKELYTKYRQSRIGSTPPDEDQPQNEDEILAETETQKVGD